LLGLPFGLGAAAHSDESLNPDHLALFAQIADGPLLRVAFGRSQSIAGPAARKGGARCIEKLSLSGEIAATRRLG
jgi:hypothetical protein